MIFFKTCFLNIFLYFEKDVPRYVFYMFIFCLVTSEFQESVLWCQSFILGRSCLLLLQIFHQLYSFLLLLYWNYTLEKFSQCLDVLFFKIIFIFKFQFGSIFKLIESFFSRAESTDEPIKGNLHLHYSIFVVQGFFFFLMLFSQNV